MTDGLLCGLLPAGIEVAERYADSASAELFVEEAEFIAQSVERRRREFATVRLCARTALAQLGVSPGPILPGPRGAPRWPDGIVGSMTHCDGYRAAAVARTERFTSIGVDAEPHEPLPDGVADAVTLPEERRMLAQLTAARPEMAWDRLLFSAKESVFKAWFPLTGRQLEFEECLLTIDPARATFTGALTVPGPVVSGARISQFPGRWRTRGGLVATAVLVGTTDGHAVREPS